MYKATCRNDTGARLYYNTHDLYFAAMQQFTFYEPSMRSVLRHTPLGAAMLTLAILAGCGDQHAGAPAGAPPPPTVSVVTVAVAALTLSTELPGRVEASRSAQDRKSVV